LIRAVLDVNVFVSAAISRAGPPSRLIAAWDAGEFELVVSPLLLKELTEVLDRPQFRERLRGGTSMLLDLIEKEAYFVEDPEKAAVTRAVDPDDNYLIDLAMAEGAALVSGDHHLTDLRATIPVFSPAEFLDYLAAA
jgi:putative PIN family toxin of toxin-antitoxin system